MNSGIVVSLRYFADYCYSSTFIMTIFILVLIFGAVLLSFLKPFKSKKANIIFKIICYVVVFAIFMSSTFVHYGFSNSFEKALISDKYLVLMEQYEQGEFMETVNRVHCVELESGKLISRKYIGNSNTIYFLFDKYLLYSKNSEFRILNLTKNRDSVVYNNKYFVENYQIFKSGIDKVEYEITDVKNKVIPMLKLNVNDGLVYFLDFQTDKIYKTDKVKLANYKADSVRIDNNAIYVGKKLFCALKEKSGTNGMFILKNNFEKQVSDEFFLYGKFVAYNTEANIFYIQSYVTTEKREFIIKAFDLRHQLLWTFNSTNIKRIKAKKYAAEMNFFIIQNNFAYFNVNGVVICLDALTGEKNWETQL